MFLLKPIKWLFSFLITQIIGFIVLAVITASLGLFAWVYFTGNAEAVETLLTTICDAIFTFVGSLY